MKKENAFLYEEGEVELWKRRLEARVSISREEQDPLED